MTYIIHTTDGGELYHHGILGQKWGQRNGPPYPLNPEDHSKAEKEAERKVKSDSSDKSGDSRKLKLTDSQKKAIAIGAAVTATALATYGAYKLGAFDGLTDTAYGSLIDDLPFNKITGEHSVEDDLSVLNPDGGTQNCMYTTFAYEMRRRGADVVANVAEKANSWNLMDVLYEDAETINLRNTNKEEVIKTISNMGNGARGNLGIQWPNGSGHSIIFENDNGRIRLLDGQAMREYPDIERLLDFVDPKLIKLCRTDNLTVNTDTDFLEMAIRNRK